MARTKKMPGMIQASVYSSVLHYLKAVKAAGTAAGPAVAAKMRELPVEDFYAPGAKIREDGRLLNDMLLVEAKAPSASKAPWDYFKVVRKIPASEIIAPLSESKCNLVKK
jgi:branched-chain amino acid transport system substrate-binding protein